MNNDVAEYYDDYFLMRREDYVEFLKIKAVIKEVDRILSGIKVSRRIPQNARTHTRDE